MRNDAGNGVRESDMSETEQTVLSLDPADKWQTYERRKRELPADLSPAEYTEAVAKIARELGI